MSKTISVRGALAVKDGDQVVPALNRYIDKFTKAGLRSLPLATGIRQRQVISIPVVAPGRRTVFKEHGSSISSGPEAMADTVIVSAGMGPDEDGYSGFLGINDSGAKLVDLLRQRGIERIFVGGLATDYCVKHTVLDGLREKFKVVLLTDSVRGVNLKPGDSERAIAEMLHAGAEIVAEPRQITE